MVVHRFPVSVCGWGRSGKWPAHTTSPKLRLTAVCTCVSRPVVVASGSAVAVLAAAPTAFKPLGCCFLCRSLVRAAGNVEPDVRPVVRTTPMNFAHCQISLAACLCHRVRPWCMLGYAQGPLQSVLPDMSAVATVGAMLAQQDANGTGQLAPLWLGFANMLRHDSDMLRA